MAHLPITLTPSHKLAALRRRATLMIALAAGACCSISHAQDTAQPPASPPIPTAIPATGGFPVSKLIIQFVREHPQNPDPATLLDAAIEIEDTPGGFAPPSGSGLPRKLWLADLPTFKDNRFTERGLTLISPAVYQRLKDLGYVGAYVIPDPAQLRVEGGHVVDLRPPGETSLTLQITLGIVTEVRTIGLGDRFDPEQKDEATNSPYHERIRARSPVLPYTDGDPVRKDLLRKSEVDDYVFRLNRQPGRRTDVAVGASGTQPGAVTLDYLVTENRPWLLFGQVANNGSSGTSAWREQFGFIHNDLTNNDDILSLTYATAHFSSLHVVAGSYDSPLFDSEVLRGKAYGSWYTYEASDVGFPDETFEGDGWTAGGELAWNFFQSHENFVDLFGGARYQRISVDNTVAAVSGDDGFLIPYVGLRLERETEVDRTNAQAAFEFGTGGDEDIDTLGRTNADESWTVLKAQGRHSFFLDPFFSDTSAKEGGLANELAFQAVGQYAFGNRLIPNEMQTAGGLYTVRGYDESVIAGDNAFIATAEYRFHVAKSITPSTNPGSLFGRQFRFAPQYKYGPTDWDLILKAFVDVGRVTYSDRLSFEKDSTLVGAGIGAELSITRHLNIRVDWGFALADLEDSAGNSVVDSGHNELHFVFTAIY